jgi:single-strand DNA-binding protein
MPRSLNKVQLIGNVGITPEISATPGGVKIARCTLATNRRFKNSRGEWVDKAEWHRLTFWDKLAGVVEEYVKKGDRIYVEARLEYSQTEDDNDRVRYWTDLVVRELIMLGAKPPAADPDAGEHDPTDPFGDNDDLPF